MQVKHFCFNEIEHIKYLESIKGKEITRARAVHDV